MIALINDTGIIVVLIGVVVLFGASRIPQLARNLGEAGREFRRGQDETGHQPAAPALVAAAVTETRGDDQVTISRAELQKLMATDIAGSATAPKTPAA